MGVKGSIICPRLLGATVAAVAATIVAASAPAPPPAAAEQCSIELYFVDQDATSNIRAEPSGTASIVGRIDPSYTVARVVAARGDWFKISSVNDYEADKDVFVGSGWIHRSILGLSVAAGNHWLTAKPDPKSKRLFKLTPDGNRLDPLDCQGEWVKVRADGKAVGWMERLAQCSNPLTTCS